MKYSIATVEKKAHQFVQKSLRKGEFLVAGLGRFRDEDGACCLLGAICGKAVDSGEYRQEAAKKLGISWFEIYALESGFESGYHPDSYHPELSALGAQLRDTYV